MGLPLLMVGMPEITTPPPASLSNTLQSPLVTAQWLLSYQEAPAPPFHLTALGQEKGKEGGNDNISKPAPGTAPPLPGWARSWEVEVMSPGTLTSPGDLSTMEFWVTNPQVVSLMES
jgi:hypothetical protein